MLSTELYCCGPHLDLVDAAQGHQSCNSNTAANHRSVGELQARWEVRGITATRDGSTYIIGLLQNSTRGLGTVKVRGLRRVPKPPTRISAFRGALLFVLAIFDVCVLLKLASKGEREWRAVTALEETGGDRARPILGWFG